MMRKVIPLKSGIYTFILLTFLSSLISACGDFSLFQTTPSHYLPESTPYPISLVTFRVTLQDKLQPGDSLFLSELDEVTGLAINAEQHLMEAESETIYSVTLSLSVGSVFKYRYTRRGSFLSHEHQSDGRPVRYRLYYVTGPGEINDVITRWTDTKYTGPTGRITGRVLDSETNEPIPNILITAGGSQTFTLSDGSYLLEGLPEGIHNLTAYAMDGTYQTYQQGARILAHSTTPADIYISHANLVEVTFTVIAPNETPSGAPLKLIGNLLQLGNTFADLSSGVSTLSARAPVFIQQKDGSYSLAIKLPAGAYLRYKYTLGDGIWNAERTSEGEIRLRELIIPNNDVQIREAIETWKSDQKAPITFEVRVPSNTPEDESIAIQFNLGYGWLEAVPMWPLASPSEEKLWRYTLFGPLNIVDSFHYRYCRAGLCGSADDSNTAGINPIGRAVNTSMLPQTIFDVVESWIWLPDNIASATIPNVEVDSRGKDFIAGIAFQTNFNPSWTPRMFDAINDVISINANWLILRPTWTFSRNSPPILDIFPRQDMLYSDIVNTMTYAINQGLKIALFPNPNFNQNIDNWWINAPRDLAWWVTWFEQYEKFIFNHASLASRYGAEAIILGGSWVRPALPNGILLDGTPSNVPEDAQSRWIELLDGVRQRFDGDVFWASPFPGGLDEPLTLINIFDGVYIQWSAPLATNPDADLNTLLYESRNLLNNKILPLQQAINKQMIIAVDYPSADGGITGCLVISNENCLQYNTLDPINFDAKEFSLDLDEQTDAYNALLAVINESDWITGFISEGYYPPLPLIDTSSSIHGKPASGVLWYWYPKIVGSE